MNDEFIIDLTDMTEPTPSAPSQMPSGGNQMPSTGNQMPSASTQMPSSTRQPRGAANQDEETSTPTTSADIISDTIITGLGGKADERAIIKIIGVGGGGCNAVNNMYRQNIPGVKFVVCNTDRKQLEDSPVPEHVQLGMGLGAGTNAEKGRQEAENAIEKIRNIFDQDTHMVFITAGMGGGTGTGAAPIIAREAKTRDILTVAIVTIPFKMEGPQKIKQALNGVQEIAKYVDALLVINNEKMKKIYGELPLAAAFQKTDNTLSVAASSISEIITMHGLINLDFEDVRTVMKDGGVAIMSTGYGEGEGRVRKAIEEALDSPLLNNNDVHNSRRVLIHLVGPSEDTPHAVMMEEMNEIHEFMNHFRSDVLMKWGYSTDETLNNRVKVTILATGFGLKDIDEVKKHMDEEDQDMRELMGEYYGEGEDGAPSPKTYKIYYFDTDDLDNDEIISLVELSPTHNRSKARLESIKEKKLPAAAVAAPEEEENATVIRF